MIEFQKLKKILLFFSVFFVFHLFNDFEVMAEDISEEINVLILNSYHQGFAWTSGETEGIIDTLTASRRNINLSVEYMDWKKYPGNANLEYIYEYLKYKYHNKEIFDLIITTDDIALEFALMNRNKLFSDAPIVFCGVNKEGADALTKGYDRVTGVIEVIDATQTIELAQHINQDLKNIYLLYDNTESGRTTGQLILEQAKINHPDLNLYPLNNMPYGDIINTVKNLDQDSIVLASTYSRDVNGRIIDMNYAMSDISAQCSTPVYAIYDFSLDTGIIGGVMLSGRIQGENAALLALGILDGEISENSQFLTQDSMRVVVDYEQLLRFNIPVKRLPKDIEIINKPFSFYETYKSMILTVIAIISILIIFITFLIIYISRIKRMKKELSDSHEELTQLYEELAASDEEMRNQYEEILTINEKIRLGEEKLSYLAYHDTLTGLPNKLSLFEASRRIFVPKNGVVALLYIDIDNFKNVNDTLGHAYGDILVKKVGERLKAFFKDNDFIYRLGGDEYVIILPYVTTSDDVVIIVKKLIDDFSTEFDLSGSLMQISLSIGIALYPEHGTVIDQLLKYADIAMYRVKNTGKKNYFLYNHSLNELFVEQINIEKCMPKALENGEFELYYQPQVDIRTNKITGFEALLRWHSSEFGEVSPMKFIRIAEDSRFIVILGKWVLSQACNFIKRIHALGYPDLMISVNISIIQLLQNDFCDTIFDVLKENELPTDFLELEITESILMESIDQIGRELKTLYDKNIKIALDDFGTGYSSLNYLAQLPISTLKIDKTFVDTILYDCENTLTGQIITLGKTMGMTTIAEGVETQEQLDFLMQYGCDKMQGYYFSKPQPEEGILKLLLD